MAAPTFVPDELVTATKMNTLPKGWLGSAQATANQSITTTQVDVTGLTVTVTVPASRRLKISFFAIAQILGGAAAAQFYMLEGATQIGQTSITAGANDYVTSIITAVRSPTAASHTYKMRGAASGNSMILLATAQYPALILVEDIGAV